MVKNGQPVSYSYRADGVKLHKSFSFNNQNIETDYLDGFVYTTDYSQEIELGLQTTVSSQDMALAGQRESFELAEKAKVVDPGGPVMSLESKPNFFATAEGFYDYENFRYIYQYKDHLGNTRLNFGRDINGDLFAEDSNDYYPFGLNFINLKGGSFQEYNPSATYKNYKYNGKELQETGMYDYGARMYMPDIGRWGVVDPLAETSRRWSSYAYAYNNPIRFIDPDGMQNEDVIITGDLKNKAFQQLQAKTSNLNLSMDDNGKVTGAIKDGAIATSAEAKLLEATNDSSVVVNLQATSENSVQNAPLVGGAFGGSTVDEKGITQTEQIVNPNQADIIENTSGRPTGTIVLHEILESYIAGKNSPGVPGYGIGGDLSDAPYRKAHSTAEVLDPTHKNNYTVSMNIDSIDTTIGGMKYGTVTTNITGYITKPYIKSNGQQHKRRTVTTAVSAKLSTAKDIRIIGR